MIGLDDLLVMNVSWKILKRCLTGFSSGKNRVQNSREIGIKYGVHGIEIRVKKYLPR